FGLGLPTKSFLLTSSLPKPDDCDYPADQPTDPQEQADEWPEDIRKTHAQVREFTGKNQWGYHQYKQPNGPDNHADREQYRPTDPPQDPSHPLPTPMPHRITHHASVAARTGALCGRYSLGRAGRNLARVSTTKQRRRTKSPRCSLS